MSKFDELITKACALVVTQEAERFDGIDTSGVEDGRKEVKMPEIDNWGYNYENETMKGYVLYALKMIKENQPELQLSEDQRQALFAGLNWATSDMTAQEAFEYYCKH